MGNGSRLVVVIGIIAGIITIFGFVTGHFKLSDFLQIFHFENESVSHPSSMDTLSTIPVNNLLKGQGTIAFSYWNNDKADFSIIKGKPVRAGVGDIGIDSRNGTAVMFPRGENAGIIDLGLANFDELAQAPLFAIVPAGNQYVSSVNVHVGRVYCMHFDNGKFYVKLFVTDFEGPANDFSVSFRYVFQRNGTNDF